LSCLAPDIFVPDQFSFSLTANGEKCTQAQESDTLPNFNLRDAQCKVHDSYRVPTPQGKDEKQAQAGAGGTLA
jgi:hypothetical protein